MPMSVDNLYRHELIGLNVIVRNVKISSKLIKGIIMDETKNTFLINTEDKEIEIIKSKSNFRFKFNGSFTEIEGISLVGRPEDRVKMKLLK